MSSLTLHQFPYISLVIPLVVFLGLFAKSLATWNLDAKNVDEPVAKLLEIFQPDVSKHKPGILSWIGWIGCHLTFYLGYMIYPGHFSKPRIPKLTNHSSSSLPSCWTPPRGWTLRPKRSVCPCVVLVCSVLTLDTLILNTTSLRMASSFQFGVRVIFGLSLYFYKQMYCARLLAI